MILSFDVILREVVVPIKIGFFYTTNAVELCFSRNHRRNSAVQGWFLVLKNFFLSTVQIWISSVQRFSGNEYHWTDVKFFWIRADQHWMSLRHQPVVLNEVLNPASLDGKNIRIGALIGHILINSFCKSYNISCNDNWVCQNSLLSQKCRYRTILEFLMLILILILNSWCFILLFWILSIFHFLALVFHSRKNCLIKWSILHFLRIFHINTLQMRYCANCVEQLKNLLTQTYKKFDS